MAGGHTTALVDVHRLGKRGGAPVRGLTTTSSHPETEIRRAAFRGNHDLVVLGMSVRRGETKVPSSGNLSLLRRLQSPVLRVVP